MRGFLLVYFFTIENPPFKECGTYALPEEVDIFSAIFLLIGDRRRL